MRRNKQQKPMVSPITLFYSYAHEDELLRNELEKHLRLLQRQGLISEWHDRQILAGDEWGQEIDEHLEAASIILLLISADFLASDYCYAIEMQRALERRKRGEARVIPIILRPCDWRTSPIAPLQCLPRDGKAVTTWQNLDEAFLAIAQGLRRTIEQERISTPPLPEVERKNRKALIKQVRTTWTEGLLDQSLHEAARLELRLQERPDALVNPWRLQVQELDRPPQPLPAGTSIVQVYDGADGELLILGEPGAGKTTLLLELARALLDRAEADEHERLPVVFNLSSWAEKHPPLFSEWLVEELQTRYRIPRKIGQSWVVSDQLLPLLDGLDEVAEEARPGCVQAINAYYQQYLEGELVPMAMVVCCRSQEYMSLPTRINLHRVVSIQPLTDEQIDHYLQSTEGQLEALRHALHTDSELYELAHRPLMLSIFTLAYRKAASEDLPTEGTRQAKPQQVFATYVERMLGRREALRDISLEQALCWLTFVASRMQQHHQTVFYLEDLQPDWLTDRRMSRRYDWLAVLLPSVLMGVLVILVPYTIVFPDFFTPFLAEAILLSGLLGWLLSGGRSVQQRLDENGGKARGVPQSRPLQQWGLAVLLGLSVGVSFWLRFDPLRGLLAGLGFGICCILLIALMGKSNTAEVPAMAHPPDGTKPQRSVRRMAVRNGLLVGLLIGLSSALSTTALSADPFTRLVAGLIFGLLGGLTSGLLSALLIERDTGVKPTDRLIWTRNSLAESLFSKRHVGSALLVVVLVGLLASFCIWLIGLINDKRSELSFGLLISGLLFGLIFGLGYWLLLGLFRGIASKTIEDEHRVVPNQGMRHSALNGLVFGLVIAILVGVSGGLAFGWVGGLIHIVFTGLIIGLSVGLLLGLLKGGLACLRHYILRILLWRSGAIPWKYVHFLEVAAERILLRKVGGGYIFIHRLLLDYFAALETGSTSDELTEYGNDAVP